MKTIDGKAIAAEILEECKKEAAALVEKGITPGLAVVLVGADPASQSYVRSKDRTCQELGFYSEKIELPAETTQEELLRVIERLNSDSKIHGILVQSPPPPHIDEPAIVRAINPEKDVDGFHPVNVAKLTLENSSGFVPCTPKGCQYLLEKAQINTQGANVVVVGRSMIVGKPLALLLMSKGDNANATVTVAHSRSKNLEAITKGADILIAAIGVPEFLKAEHVSEGAVVIDVGVNRVEDSSKKSGYRLVGDVAYDEVAPLCSAITPVPGGVGPMTIAMLMKNTLQACAQQSS